MSKAESIMSARGDSIKDSASQPTSPGSDANRRVEDCPAG